MSRCKHNNIQQFTDMCLDCGHNINESDAEYEESLRRDIAALQDKARAQRIERLEERKRELEDLTKEDDGVGGGEGGW